MNEKIGWQHEIARDQRVFQMYLCICIVTDKSLNINYVPYTIECQNWHVKRLNLENNNLLTHEYSLFIATKNILQVLFFYVSTLITHRNNIRCRLALILFLWYAFFRNILHFSQSNFKDTIFYNTFIAEFTKQRSKKNFSFNFVG